MVEPDELIAKSLEMAESIATSGAFQLWMTKETMWQRLDASSLRHAILTENRTQIMASMTGDVEEALIHLMRRRDQGK